MLGSSSSPQRAGRASALRTGPLFANLEPEEAVAMRALVILAVLRTAAIVQAEEWNCRNDLEIRCGEKCEVSDDFTPMDVTVDDQGKLSACAYSGCWEGQGKALVTEDFLTVAAHGLPFSTAASEQQNANVLVGIDLGDQIGVIKVGGFAMPLICKKR
jgi:hypothetical protein